MNQLPKTRGQGERSLMEPAALIAPTAAPAISDVRVETISDYKSFLDLEPVWNDLVEAAGIDHPFLTYEWVRTWWECFGEGKQLHILVVKDGTGPIAIAPLMVSPGRMYGLRVRQIESLGNVHTQRFDFIMARRAREAYSAIWKRLVNDADQWDMLQLCQLPPGSRTLEELPKLAAADGFLTGLWHSGDSPYLPLTGGWEATGRAWMPNIARISATGSSASAGSGRCHWRWFQAV